MNFWEQLPKPFFVMAPMADVTDCVYRQIIAECCMGLEGKRIGPDVFFTEFVAADGLAHPVARERLLIDWRYSELERPIVAQMFGSRPENIRAAAALARELGFDGVDINMGCPEANICKQGAGADLIRNPDLARQVIAAAKEGSANLPVSVKTRLGYTSVSEFDEWFKVLLECDLAAITVHLRTKKEMSKVPAHWELAGGLRETARNFISLPSLRGLRQNKISGSLPMPKLVANGDVRDLVDARVKAGENDLDGVMLGRAIFGNPWLFSQREKSPEQGRGAGKPDWPEVFRVMLRHAELFEQTFITEPQEKLAPRSLGGVGKPYKNFAIMRKFFGSYVAGHPRASELKLALVQTTNASEVRQVLDIHV